MDKFENTINQIRDILRKEGITGMDSIKHCLLFMFMKFLDTNKCKLLKIDPMYSFEQISSLTDENEIKARVFVKGKICLVNLLKKDGIFNVDFKLQSNANLKTIIRKIGSVNMVELSLKTDIVGIIYELHLKSGTSQAMRDLGQYFTNREVIDWMVKLTDPKIKNKKTGEIEKILDPSMGTGGFLTMAIKHLNNTNKKIDWTVNKNNVFGFDIDENVTQMSLLNAFIETGLLFDKTIIKHDTLHADYVLEDGTFIDKVDVILANEPFGLKNITHAECCDRIKELKIRGTKAEPLFLQLMMLSLNEGGRCAVVVPDGVLFNDSNLHTGTRQYLVDNLNLKKVVSLNGDFFLNTGVKSSILYFINDGKTSQVEFSELVFSSNKLKENSIYKVNYKDIVSNDYSLFVNKYNTVEEKKLDGIKYMKLGEVCELKIGGTPRRNVKEYWDNGTNVWVSIAEMNNNIIYDSKEKITDLGIRDSNVKLLKKDTILMSFKMSLGKKAIAGTDLYTNEAIVGINSINPNELLNKYIYYIIDKFNFSQACSSIAKGNMNKDKLGKIQIPIPSIEKQKEIIETLDVFYEQIERNTQSIKAYEHIKKSIVRAHTNKCTNIKKLGDICNVNSYSITKNYQYKMIKYIDIGSISNNLILQEFTIGNEPSRARRIVKLSDILLATVRPGLENIIFVDNDIYHDNLIASTGFAVLTSHSVIPKYLYYYLLQPSSTEYFVKNSTGSLYPSMNMSTILNFKIPIPSKEVQELVVKECEYYDEQINRLKKENEKLKAIPVIEMSLESESKESTETSQINDIEIENESESEPETEELEIKGKVYIREGDNVYIKGDNGDKGQLYGTWSNGKVKKVKPPKEIDL